MRRVLTVTAGAIAAVLMSTGPALACGGLIGPNGAVNLTRTTTFAGYAGGVEHYITAFNFAGGTGKFGSITPLPGVPTKVERGGDWTLQRLVRETQPVLRFAASEGASSSAAASPAPAQVLFTAKVDALDITVLKGSGDAVGRWAKEHGFRLPPDAPEVLDFYGRRSPIFMAAAFDADRARAKGQRIGDGTPLHLTIPTKQPWVPLRILGLGKRATDNVTADVFLLTERRPAMLPAPTPESSVTAPGLVLAYDQQANAQLLQDLHNDKSGSWVPLQDMWLTKVVVADTAGGLKYDLAIDQTGAGKPSIYDAGYTVNGLRPPVQPVAQAVTASADPVTAAAVPSALPQAPAAVASPPSRHSGNARLVVGVAIAALVAGGLIGAAGRRTR